MVFEARNHWLQLINVCLEVGACWFSPDHTLAARHLLILPVDVIIVIFVSINTVLPLGDEFIKQLAPLLCLLVLVTLLKLISLSLILAEPITRVALIGGVLGGPVESRSLPSLFEQVDQLLVGGVVVELCFILDVIDVVPVSFPVPLDVVSFASDATLSAIVDSLGVDGSLILVSDGS